MADAKNKDNKNDEKTDETVVVSPTPRSFAVPGNDLSGYIGVAPEYQTYADPSHKPYLTEDEARLYGGYSEEDLEELREVHTVPGVDVAENERPTVAEGTTSGSSGASPQTSAVNSLNYDPVAGYSHAQVTPVSEEGEPEKSGSPSSDESTPPSPNKPPAKVVNPPAKTTPPANKNS